MKKNKRSPKPRPKRKRLRKFLFFIILILAFLLTASHLLINHFETQLMAFIIDKIQEKTHNWYSISYSGVDLDFFMRTIEIKNLSISPSSQRPSLNPGSPKVMVTSDISHLKLKGISYWDILLNHRLSVDSLSIEGGQAVVAKRIPKTSKYRDLLRLKELSLNMEDLSIYLKKRNHSQNDTAPNIKHSSNSNKKGYVSFRAGTVLLKDVSLLTANGFYKVSAERINVTKPDDSIQIAGFKLVPMYRKYQFSAKRGRRTTRFFLQADTLVLEGLDTDTLLARHCLWADRLTVENLEMDMFRNHRIEKRKKVVQDRYPLHLLKKIKTGIDIGHVILKNSSIRYSIHAPHQKRPGTVYFDKLDARLKNISNLTYPSKTTEPLSLIAKTRVMGQSPLQLKMRMPLSFKPRHFSVSGKMGQLNMTAMNSILKNANIRIESGRANSLQFSLEGDNSRIEGDMRFRYSDLELSLMKKKASKKRRWFVSFLANWIVRKENPNSHGSLRIGNIYYKKKQPMSFFKYIGNALLTGFNSSVGLKKAKARH